jgi:ATP-dependent DNA helicase RecG
MTRDIPERESLTVEFKSDRARLADRDLIAALICLANTEGGEIYLGVEDDGRVTGLHPAHQNLTGLTALIANLTSPPLTARVEAIDVEPHRIARISVPNCCVTGGRLPTIVGATRSPSLWSFRVATRTSAFCGS